MSDIPMDAAGEPSKLATRIHAVVEHIANSDVARWSAAAAAAFDQQLSEFGGIRHAQLVRPLSAWVGLTAEETRAVEDALDLMQVAFDFADNLVDEREDIDAGRSYHLHYVGIPKPSRVCLPALLLCFALERLRSGCAMRSGIGLANTKSLAIFATMAQGQSVAEEQQKIKLVAGRQASLLCLPVWIATPEDHETIEQLEIWAQSWGTSWEYACKQHEAPGPENARLWKWSVALTRRNWPNFGPFVGGHEMSVERLLAGGIS